MLRMAWLCAMFLVVSAGLAACGDDQPASSDAGRQDAAIEASVAPCKVDSDCDDDLFCSGQETCLEGVCVAGEAVACDDGIACTVDRCSERKRGCESLPPDLDGDGHYTSSCMDNDGKALGDDCDDDDPLRFPGNIEVCDAENKDDDCNPATFGEKDSDDDGFFDALCCNAESDAVGAKLVCGNDCDDLKASVNPKATEACDLFDNDCDGETDEGVSIKHYPDADHDGHGAKGSGVKSVMMCPGAVGFALVSNDCNDADPEVFEGQFEICDGKDNDCDDKTDEVEEDAPWFVDADGDGFGDSTSTPVYSCQRIPGRVLSSNDCSDDNAMVHPAAAELCDAVDNDCNGKKDFSLGTNDFEDDDDDGVADVQCTGGQDCDDRDGTTGQGKEEICDLRDNDCDKIVDEQTAQTVWYLDRDGDGWGVGEGTALARCEPIPGRAANLGDCDDDENSVRPGAIELCNGVDDDCDGKKDEGADFQCSLDHAVSFCKLGGCSVLSCFPGFDDCDANAANGCECVAPIVPLQDIDGNDIGCADDTDCSDANYCNGKERCTGGLCYAGIPVNCSASGAVLQGSLFIQNSLDIQMLAGIQTVTGNVAVSASGLVNLTGLEDLRTIGGDLIIDGDTDDDGLSDTYTGNQALKALVGSGLSNLLTVSGSIIIEDNKALTTIRLPSLVTAGALIVRRNPALVTLDGFGSLVKIEGVLEISENAQLVTLSGLQALTSTGRLYIGDNGLTRIALAKLARIRGDADFNRSQRQTPDNTVLTEIELPELTKVEHSLILRDLVALTTVSMPKLATLGRPSYPPNDENTPYFEVARCSALTSLENLGAATITCPSKRCGAGISSNGSLSSCDVAEYMTNRLVQFSGSWYGNGSDVPDAGLQCPSEGYLAEG